MPEPSLPSEICSRLDRIAWYTIRLTEAARARDLEKITSVLESRARAVNELEAHVEHFRAEAGSRVEGLLARKCEMLERQASTALEQLQLMLDGMRAATEELSQQTSAARSYVEQQLPGPELDRSG